MFQNKKIFAVVPAYNAGKTLDKTLAAIPYDIVDTVIVVDDGSSDTTPDIARRSQVELLRHETNQGYGAAQKTGYRAALASGADVVVMVHADFQYDPTLLPTLVLPILSGSADACFGSRMAHKRQAWQGGMHWWRFVANICLTMIEELVLRLGLTEYHTGYRAYSEKVLRTIPFEKNSDNYVFDTEMIAELKLGGFHVDEVPIPTRYFADASSPNFLKSVQYGFSTLHVLVRYILFKLRIKTYSQFVMKIPDQKSEIAEEVLSS